MIDGFLPLILNTDHFWEYAIANAAGTMSKRVRAEDLMKYEFPLPPVDEQRRIADLLWAADDAIENCQELLAKATALRVPLINNCMGIETPDEVKEVITGLSKTTRQNWTIKNVESICTKERQGVQVGPFGGSVSSKYFAETGIPVLKINNITDTGELDISEMIFLNTEHANSLSDKYSVIPGDIVTAAQASIGRTAIVSEAVSGAIISQHLIRIAVDNQMCLPEWLHACFQTPLVIRQMKSVVQGGTRAGLNTNDVKKIRIPIPPIEFQKEFCEKISAITENSNKVSEHLNYSINLKKNLLQTLIG